MRRLFGLLAALALAISIAPVATAHSDPTAHYWGDCIAAYHGTHSHGVVWLRDERNWTAGYTGSRGVIHARVMNACPNGQPGYMSGTWLLGANLQRSNALAQLGIGAISLHSGVYDSCSSGVSKHLQGTTEFIYTPWPDYAQGHAQEVCRAHWVDFNHDSIPDNPVSGQDYRTTITIGEQIDGTGYDAIFSVVRLSDGAVSSIRKPFPASSADSTWYGCEAISTGNQLGTKDNADGRIFETAYRPTIDTQWWYTEDSAYSWNSWTPEPKRSFYEVTQSQAGNGESFNCYTQLHTSND